MFKKAAAVAIASLTILSLTIFSLTSVLAQDGSETPSYPQQTPDGSTPQGPSYGQMTSGTASYAPAPLSSPRDLCREARKNYSAQVRSVKAKGLSLHLSRQEINDVIRSIRDYRNQVCAKAQALTSPKDVCKAARKNYSAQVRSVRAKGLSFHLSQQEIRQMIADIRDYRNRVCVEARGMR